MAIYLDYAAATPMDDEVLEAMKPYFREKFYNPSANYLAAKQVAQDLLVARKTVAGWLGCQAAEIYFTAGGTEANNLAVQGIMRAFPGTNAVVSAIEHESVMAPAEMFENQQVRVDERGQIDLSDLEKAIDDKTVLVSIMYANNEIGSIQPLGEIAAILQEIRLRRLDAGSDLPLYFHTDACQAAAYLDLHVHRLGVDLMTLNGGKIYGPKQSGVLMARAGTRIAPLILGGGQENSMRSGTENMAGAIGFAKALDLVQSHRQTEAERLLKLRQTFERELAQRLPEIRINGGLKRRLCNNLNITFPGEDNERLLMELDERGIMCASGSACSASNEEPSHVLRALGLSDDNIRSSLRFSLGKGTSEQDLIRVAEELQGLVHKSSGKTGRKTV